jgi:predicted CoA-binding protein
LNGLNVLNVLNETVEVKISQYRAKALVSGSARCYNVLMNRQENLIDDSNKIALLIRETKRIAVLGIKTEAQSDQPSVYVPQYMQRAGYEIIPVPVYYPDATVILGEKVYRRLADIPGDVDMVDVFRRPPDINGHIEDILAKKPKSVWFQSGIRNDAAAEIFAKAGIKVVQDR